MFNGKVYKNRYEIKVCEEEKDLIDFTESTSTSSDESCDESARVTTSEEITSSGESTCVTSSEESSTSSDESYSCGEEITTSDESTSNDESGKAVTRVTAAVMKVQAAMR